MDALDPNIAFLWRAIERFANVLIGALAIYLGYKLFMNLPERRENHEGELKLMLPGDISVYASRVAPGVFFALFGTAVVLMSFVSSMELHSGVQAKGAAVKQGAGQPEVMAVTAEAATQPATIYSYVSGEADVDRISTDRAAVQRDLATLRGLEGALDEYIASGQGPAMTPNDANTLLSTIPRVKRLLILSVWDEGWGDPRAFTQWVKQGAVWPPPAGMETVAGIFSDTR